MKLIFSTLHRNQRIENVRLPIYLILLNVACHKNEKTPKAKTRYLPREPF